LKSNFHVIVPTLNAAGEWPQFESALLANISPEQVLIIDSSSTDGTADLARAAGFRVHSIAPSEFNHGATRQLGADLLGEVEILVYLTQDAVLATSDAIDTLLEAFADPEIAAAYGRQLPRPGANGIEVHARLFNYSSESRIRNLEMREELGIKTAFISNSFSAYRRSQLIVFGGFPRNTILAEDMVIAARFLLGGLKVAYVAEAQVYHSHAYTWAQDFKRYFDTGVLHSREKWLLGEFGQVNGEGKRFVASELSHLWREEALLIPSALVRTGLKLLGYRLGKMEHKLSVGWKRRLSMHRSFWK
jgi:rhamnosyltransferase